MDTIRTGLIKSIAEEKKAASVYRRRAGIAHNKGDLKTERLYLHIAHEENVHESEFARRVREV